MVVIVKHPPWNKGALCALLFAQAACIRKHQVQVFFYHDGVFNSNNAQWPKLAEQYNISLNICSAAAKLRNITENNIPKNFNLTGIGALTQEIDHNKVITFG